MQTLSAPVSFISSACKTDLVITTLRCSTHSAKPFASAENTATRWRCRTPHYAKWRTRRDLINLMTWPATFASASGWAHVEHQTKMKPYTELLESLLVMEYNKTPERAKELVKNNPNIVTQGIMHGNQSLRASAMLLDDIDVKAQDASAPNEKVSDER